MVSITTVVRLFIGIPTIWIIGVLLVDLRESYNQPVIDADDEEALAAMRAKRILEERENEKIKVLEAENKDMIAMAAHRHELERKMALKNGPRGNNAADHPERELRMIFEQQRQQQNQRGRGGGGGGGLNFQMRAPDFNPNAPGELGKPVHVDKDELDADEKRAFDEGWEKNAFNQFISDLISVRRSLPDIRDSACKSVKWFSPLPTTSVIIIFHNEAWSTLLRTVHSVIDRSDPALLKEIILVDDFSDMSWSNLIFHFSKLHFLSCNNE